MAIDRKTFFAYARRAPFGGRLSTAQIAGMEATLAEWERRRFADLRWLAYMLATDFHESAGTMQPVIETRRAGEPKNPSVDQAIARLERSWAGGGMPWVRTAYWRKDVQGRSWLGRGKPQITHRANYARVGQAIGVDLVADPDRLLDLDVSTRAMFAGMTGGLFTGKKLADYFNEETDDPVGARRIVNGTDKSKLIAGYYRNFLDALQAADSRSPLPEDVSPAEAEPDDVPVAQSGTAMAVGTATIGGVVTAGCGLVTTAIAGISNQWALIAFGLVLLLLLVAGGAGAWLWASGRLTLNRSKAA